MLVWTIIHIIIQLRPDQDFSAELGPSVIRGSWKDPPSAPHRSSSPSPTSSRRSSHLLILPSSPTTNTLNVQTHLLRSRKSSVSDKSSDSPYSSDPDDLVDDKERGMHQLTLRKASHLHSEESKEEQHERFHGQSSYLPLIDATRRYKQQHLIESGDLKTRVTHSLPSSRIPNPIRRPEYWQAPRVCFLVSFLWLLTERIAFSGSWYGKAFMLTPRRCCPLFLQHFLRRILLRSWFASTSAT